MHVVELQVLFRKRLHQLGVVFGEVNRIVVQSDFGLLHESVDYFFFGRNILKLAAQVKLDELPLQAALVEDMGAVEVVEHVAEDVLVADIALLIDVENVKLPIEALVLAAQVVRYLLVLCELFVVVVDLFVVVVETVFDQLVILPI